VHDHVEHFAWRDFTEQSVRLHAMTLEEAEFFLELSNLGAVPCVARVGTVHYWLAVDSLFLEYPVVVRQQFLGVAAFCEHGAIIEFEIEVIFELPAIVSVGLELDL
jgi:hypothetical protein